MKKLMAPVAVLASLAVIVVMLISSVEIAAYGNFEYYRKEYEKYSVLDDVDMEMEDLMHVTREMMAYLRGNRNQLSVETTVSGRTMDFFNEQDRFHMWEVQKLFIGGMRLRAMSAAIAVVSILLMAAVKVPLRRLFSKAFLWTVGILMALVLALAVWALVDFNTLFTYFHLLFFDNDLWLFDPATDLMINVLVEGFFMDMALRIVVIFGGMLLAASGLCIGLLAAKPGKNRRNLTKTAALILAFAVGVPGMAPMTAKADPTEGDISAAPTLVSPVTELKTQHVDHEFAYPEDWPEAPEVNAGAAILYEATTGTVLYAKNADVELYPASITKIMTGLLVAEYGRMSDIITYTRDAIINNLEWGAMTVGISVDEQISVLDSFYAMMLSSANDAANGLAEYISGSNESFSTLMNSRAKSIGAYNTNFSNPSGLFGADHYTTCYDMALIMAEAIQNRLFMSVATTMYYESEPTNRYPQYRYFYQQHKFKPNAAYEYDGFVCGKTGFVDESGNTLVTYCERNGLKLISVVMRDNNPGHYEDTTLLMDFGFENFKLCQIDGTLLSGEGDTDYLSGFDGLFEQAGFSIEENMDSVIIIPQTAELSDVDCTLNYDPESKKENGNIIADIVYSYHGMIVGNGTLEFVPTMDEFSDPKDIEESQEAEEPTQESEGSAEGPAEEEPKTKEVIITLAQVLLFIGIVLAVVIVVIILVVYFNPAKVRARRIRRRRKARQIDYKLPDDFL